MICGSAESTVGRASSAAAWLLSGLGERALKLMTRRALARTAFKKLIAEQGAFRKQLAECRIELDAARCVCTVSRGGRVGPHNSAPDSLAKVTDLWSNG